MLILAPLLWTQDFEQVESGPRVCLPAERVVLAARRASQRG